MIIYLLIGSIFALLCMVYGVLYKIYRLYRIHLEVEIITAQIELFAQTNAAYQHEGLYDHNDFDPIRHALAEAQRRYDGHRK